MPMNTLYLSLYIYIISLTIRKVSALSKPTHALGHQDLASNYAELAQGFSVSVSVAYYVL